MNKQMFNKVLTIYQLLQANQSIQTEMKIYPPMIQRENRRWILSLI